MPNLKDLVQNQNSSGRGAHPSVWRGLVVNITAASVWVRIPQLAQDDIAATNTIAGDLTPGDRVIIAAVEGRVDNLVVIAKENPTIPAHTHAQTDITYPGWTAATLAAGWAAATEDGAYSGLRYRRDSRFIHLHGYITGTPGTITTLPSPPAHSSRLIGVTGTGGTAVLTLAVTGALTTSHSGGLHLNVSAPLT